MKKVKFVNLTPHEINLNGEVIPPSGQVARVSVKTIQIDNLSFPAVKNEYGEVEGLPEPAENTYYIVSSFVFSQTNREDVIAPNTSNAVRDEKGRIVGVKEFIVH